MLSKGNLLLLFAAAVGMTSLRADILANEDFKDGTAHWAGDLKNMIRPSDNSPGLGIKLTDDWVHLYQTFNTHAVSLDLEIRYMVSADCVLFDPPPPVSLPTYPADAFLRAKQGNATVQVPIFIHPGNWGVILEDPQEDLTTFTEITPTAGHSEVQVATAHFPMVMRHEEKRLLLVFPRGKGSVTLLRVSLQPSSVPYTKKIPDDMPKQNP